MEWIIRFEQFLLTQTLSCVLFSQSPPLDDPDKNVLKQAEAWIVLFCAPGLPLLLQLVGRVNWKHGLRMEFWLTHITWNHHQLCGFSLGTDSTLRLWKTPRSAQESHSLCQFQPLVVTFCIGTKQKDDPRDTNCTRQESAIASQWTPPPMVRDSQLLHRVKDKSSRWMRTNEIEALKGWKMPVACGLGKTPFAPTHSMKLLPNSTFGTVIWKPRNAYEWQEWLDLWSLRELYHTLGRLSRWIQICQGFGKSFVTFAVGTAGWLSKHMRT